MEDFKESLNHMSFLKKFSYELYTGKPFAWKDMLSALSLFSSVYTIPCCPLCRDVVIVNNYFYIDLPPEAIRFFLLPHPNKG